MSKVACLGQLVWGTPLEAFVHIFIRLCIRAAFNGQCNTEDNFPWTAPRKSIQRLVGADLYVKTNVHRPVHTDLYVQARRYRFVCTDSVHRLVHTDLYVQARRHRFVYKLARTDFHVQTHAPSLQIESNSHSPRDVYTDRCSSTGVGGTRPPYK